MVRPTYQWFAQMGAALGVVVSLGLVAYELKQSQSVAIADIFQQRSAMAIDMATSVYSPELLSQAHYRATYDPGSVTLVDLAMLRAQAESRFIYFANEHFQFQIGMLSEEHWAAAKKFMSAEFRRPCTRQIWRIQEDGWRDSFAKEVNAVLNSLADDIAECKLPEVQDLLPRN